MCRSREASNNFNFVVTNFFCFIMCLSRISIMSVVISAQEFFTFVALILLVPKNVKQKDIYGLAPFPICAYGITLSNGVLFLVYEKRMVIYCYLKSFT